MNGIPTLINRMWPLPIRAYLSGLKHCYEIPGFLGQMSALILRATYDYLVPLGSRLFFLPTGYWLSDVETNLVAGTHALQQCG